MSIEEVIDFLKSKKKLYSQMDESGRKDYVMECLDTAINLLSNKTDGDLISRDFMKKLGATCIAKRSEIGELVAISSIDNLPSAEKTAEWILFDEDKNVYECSSCKEPFILMADTPKENNYNYCPNCGCEMRKEKTR